MVKKKHQGKSSCETKRQAVVARDIDSQNRDDETILEEKNPKAKCKHGRNGGGQAAYDDPHNKVEATDVPSRMRDPELKEWFDKKCELEDLFDKRLDDFK